MTRLIVSLVIILTLLGEWGVFCNKCIVGCSLICTDQYLCKAVQREYGGKPATGSWVANAHVLTELRLDPAATIAQSADVLIEWCQNTVSVARSVMYEALLY